MSTLHIAQKNSIAKQVANILSNGQKTTGFTRSKFNPVYQFKLNDQPHRFSSVRGHIYEHYLPEECKSWTNYDNKKILTRNVQVLKKYGNDMQCLARNLQDLSKKAKTLVLWLDCDREGEAIAFQVIQICTRVNKYLKIKRARFSAVTRTDIIQAYQNLVEPNQKQSNAVSYRMQIDFRLGCTFTRYQTVFFNQKFSNGSNQVLSYGPCQLPTLGFVVQRYLENKYFVPQDYYFLTAICVIDQNTGIDLKWTKKNTKDKIAIDLIYLKMCQKSNQNESFKGKVIKRSKNVKKKYRPYPLTTVQLQKTATQKLKMSSAQVMQIAEKLYQRGFLSYPRTQTNAFPKTMNLKALIDRLKGNFQYNNYVERLLEGGQYLHPKIGNSDDQAHSPIHPVRNANKDQLTHEQWKVYDLISRHFLACCSKDAIGQEYQVLVEIAGQQFKASYLTIKQKNFLDIYPFIKWSNTTLAGQLPQNFNAIVNIGQQKTKPPGYLTQSNLIQIMQKNNIGTDSTIHQHIQTIQKRNYAIKYNNTFKPTSLGASLIIAYRNLGLRIAECDVRRMMEQNMEKIVQGQLNHIRAVEDTLKYMLQLFVDLTSKKNKWQQEIGKALQDHKGLGMALQNINNHQNGNNSNINNNNNYIIQSNSNNNNGVTCFKCKKTGHYANQCTQNNNNGFEQSNFNNNRPKAKSIEPNSRAQQVSNNNNSTSLNSTNSTISNITCYKCNQKGHIAPNCSKTNRKPNKSHDNNSSRNGGFKKYNNNKKKYQQSTSQGYNSNIYNQSINQSYQDQTRNKKTCNKCGIQGRHPKGSNCPTIKRKNNQTEGQNRNMLEFL